MPFKAKTLLDLYHKADAVSWENPQCRARVVSKHTGLSAEYLQVRLRSPSRTVVSVSITAFMMLEEM